MGVYIKKLEGGCKFEIELLASSVPGKWSGSSKMSSRFLQNFPFHMTNDVSMTHYFCETIESEVKNGADILILSWD